MEADTRHPSGAAFFTNERENGMKTPDARLLAAAALVREGAYLADVGTDHAYLPVYLCRTGRISRAIAADIGEGPLAAAAAHIAEAGLSSRIVTVLTDGLAGLEGRGLTDIAICGMGGELIARILSDAPFVRDPSVRLILQPMSRPAALRAYLAENGFAIRKEVTVEAGGRPYFCLAASFCGTPYALTAAEAELGMHRTAHPTPVLRRLWERALRVAQDRLSGALARGEDGKEARAYLAELHAWADILEKGGSPCEP